jgi:phosphoribosylanthranilate isomerase
MLPFKIKICGLTDPANVGPTVAAGAQALGLNFFSGSKRYLEPDLAVLLGETIPAGVVRVGVFVNDLMSPMMIHATGIPSLDFIQLHGEETAQEVADLYKLIADDDPAAKTPGLIKAFRLKSDPETEIGPFLDECKSRGVPLAGMLIDAFSSAGHGGTGERADWAALGRWTDRRGVPLILAGGITPENVAEAIATVRPDAIDTASGVESAPGIKDPARVRALVQAAEVAWKS